MPVTTTTVVALMSVTPASGGGVECSCSDNVNMKLGNNGKMCVPVVNNCSNSGLFVCANGRCIPTQMSCDGDNDCGDSSDENEQFCAERTCPAFSFVCGNGRCIAPHWRCDHDNDCGDGSDELDCAFPTCGTDQFMCSSSRCIDITEVKFIWAASQFAIYSSVTHFNPIFKHISWIYIFHRSSLDWKCHGMDYVFHIYILWKYSMWRYGTYRVRHTKKYCSWVSDGWGKCSWYLTIKTTVRTLLCDVCVLSADMWWSR